MHMIVIMCCKTRIKCSKYEHLCKLHRFHILCISCCCISSRRKASITNENDIYVSLIKRCSYPGYIKPVYFVTDYGDSEINLTIDRYHENDTLIIIINVA